VFARGVTAPHLDAGLEANRQAAANSSENSQQIRPTFVPAELTSLPPYVLTKDSLERQRYLLRKSMILVIPNKSGVRFHD